MQTTGRFIKSIVIIAGLIVVFTLTFLWVPDATPEHMITVRGTVEDINESGGPHDIVFKLRNDPGRYFINRGSEKGLKIDSLKYFVLDREVELSVIKMRFNLFSPTHIARVVASNQVLYSNLAEK